MNGFIKTLDQSTVGIQGQMTALNELLRFKDPAIWAVLERLGVHPQFYSFRWLTLLLSQEFELPDVLRLWDTLLSDSNRFEHLSNVCVAMLINEPVRKRLLAASTDFAVALRSLQSYPPTPIQRLLDLANQIASPDWSPLRESSDRSESSAENEDDSDDSDDGDDDGNSHGNGNGNGNRNGQGGDTEKDDPLL